MRQIWRDILSKVFSVADGSSVEASLQGCLAFDDRVGGGRCPLQGVGCRFKLCYCTAIDGETSTTH